MRVLKMDLPSVQENAKKAFYDGDQLTRELITDFAQLSLKVINGDDQMIPKLGLLTTQIKRELFGDIREYDYVILDLGNAGMLRMELIKR